MSEKKSKFSEIFRYFVPGFVLMSILIGGGFATGREIVEFGGRFGSQGLIVGISIAIVFSIICMISYEISRIYKVYDYRSHMKVYAGPLTYVFDILIFVASIVVMAVMASAVGNILQTTLHIPYYAGVFSLVVLCGIIIFRGSDIVEKFSVVGGMVLYIGYIIFAILAITGRTDNIIRVFAESDTSYLGESFSFLYLFWIGMIFCGYNIQPMTTVFFTLKDVKTRKEALISGFLSGFIVVIPWFLTYIALMSYYPSKEVFDAPIPWLIMMIDVHPVIVICFGIIAGWTLIASAVGVMNSIINRIDKQLEEQNKTPMTNKTRVILTSSYLIGAIVLSRIGIIDLIAKGYSMISYGMIISFLLPLITFGLYKAIVNFKQEKKEETILTANNK